MLTEINLKPYQQGKQRCPKYSDFTLDFVRQQFKFSEDYTLNRLLIEYEGI